MSKSFLSSLRFPNAKCLMPLALLCCCAAMAGGFSKTYSLDTGGVVVTNNQKRSCWVPSALLFHFTEPVDTTVSIKRLSEGHEYVLSKTTFTNTQDIIWIPEADYSFNFGDALIVTTTATSGTLEIIQRSD